jgi:hypothetical protein
LCCPVSALQHRTCADSRRCVQSVDVSWLRVSVRTATESVWEVEVFSAVTVKITALVWGFQCSEGEDYCVLVRFLVQWEWRLLRSCEVFCTVAMNVPAFSEVKVYTLIRNRRLSYGNNAWFHETSAAIAFQKRVILTFKPVYP